MNGFKVFSHVMLIALLTLIGTDALLYARVLSLSYSTYRQRSAVVRESGGVGPQWLPSGKGEITPDVWVVRFASRNCQYYEQEKDVWADVSKKLHKEGYQIITVVPGLKDAYDSNASALHWSQQDALVSMEWLKHLKLRKTPTVMVFSRTEGMIWLHQGVMKPIDSNALLTELAHK